MITYAHTHREQPQPLQFGTIKIGRFLRGRRRGSLFFAREREVIGV